MIKQKLTALIALLLTCSSLQCSEFTVGSYNCGGLSEHFDYIRAAAMHKIVKQRHQAEPENMALLEKIERLALKKLFADTPEDRMKAEKKWVAGGYEDKLRRLTMDPAEEGSCNAKWNGLANAAITSYKQRPVSIFDPEIISMLSSHIGDLTGVKGQWSDDDLLAARSVMAQRIFAHQLTYDILCLQEADYLSPELFPEHYDVLIPDSTHLKNGLAWNKHRFELTEDFGSLQDRSYIVKLTDKETGKTILAATGHLTGCNPFIGMNDSEAGDNELRAIVNLFLDIEADIKLIALDSNVTASHPRLKILQEAGYMVDYRNYLEPTCTNPHQVLNTRIDWIAIKVEGATNGVLQNIPVHDVGLNSIQTNISDHKPVAAKVTYDP